MCDFNSYSENTVWRGLFADRNDIFTSVNIPNPITIIEPNSFNDNVQITRFKKGEKGCQCISTCGTGRNSDLKWCWVDESCPNGQFENKSLSGYKWDKC